ncbi:MAG: polyprenyl synthetase family protein, partial [Gemmatimonadales bacterium]|nr:polyprenyl synthetase family protein [Gemmatimonadales bacterium]
MLAVTAASPPGAREAEVARAFVARARPLLEEALASAVRAPGPTLGWVERASALAVGTDGRGGRRWRPLLAMAAAEAVGGDPRAALGVAVALELTHTASLVLDDLPCMDDAELRRGRPAVHRHVGQAGTILLAIGMLGRAAELLGSAPRGAERLGAEWGRAIGFAGMAGGQAVDVAQAGPAVAAARRLHREKTTALARLALVGGARVGGAAEPTVQALGAAGALLGWAYQVLDDDADRREDGALGRGATCPGTARVARLGARAARRI